MCMNYRTLCSHINFLVHPQNMMGKILALDLKPKGIALVMVHPGFLKTDMTAHYAHFYEEFGAMSPEEAVGPIMMAVKKVNTVCSCRPF
jgi:NAD(P)-dependent dehydrogenase (short-subunit alcohol dehydrogenase family)